MDICYNIATKGGFAMKIEKTNLNDCYILTPNVPEDERGYFSVPFNIEEVEKLGFYKNFQTNESGNSKGVLRGMHFQDAPDTQTKIVRVINGTVIDVVVDMRKDSSTYGQYTSALLTEENRQMLYVPRGFAHGFLALEDDTRFQYFVDNIYSPKKDGGILWNDPEIKIPWEQWCKEYGIQFDQIMLKEADMKRPRLKDCNVNFYSKYRYLVTGVTGQLGYDVVRELNSRGIYDVLALGSNEMDITNKRRVEDIIRSYQPEIIIHCGAYTNVKNAETEEGKLLAHNINVMGTRNMVRAAEDVDAKFIYVSTDYVFDGKKGTPYEIQDATNPLNVYGQSKLLGEEIAKTYSKSYIVRTSWVFGSHSKTPNFIENILKQAQTKDKLTVVNDQLGSPTYTVDLAKFLVDLSATEAYGLYQAHNEGYCSWYDFATYALQEAGISTPIEPITSNTYPSSVERPMDSRMSTTSLSENHFSLLPDWENAVKRYIKEKK